MARDTIAEIIKRERGDPALCPGHSGAGQGPSADRAAGRGAGRRAGPSTRLATGPGISPDTAKDPREGDAVFEQAQRLMKAIDSVLNDTARNRGEARKLPSDQ